MNGYYYEHHNYRQLAALRQDLDDAKQDLKTLSESGCMPEWRPQNLRDPEAFLQAEIARLREEFRALNHS